MSTLWLCINNQKQTMQHICPQNCYLKEEKSVIKKFVHCFNSAANYSSFFTIVIILYVLLLYIKVLRICNSSLRRSFREYWVSHKNQSQFFFSIIIWTPLNVNCSCVKKYLGFVFRMQKCKLLSKVCK